MAISKNRFWITDSSRRLVREVDAISMAIGKFYSSIRQEYLFTYILQL
jgi:hypothetical protein